MPKECQCLGKCILCFSYLLVGYRSPQWASLDPVCLRFEYIPIETGLRRRRRFRVEILVEVEPWVWGQRSVCLVGIFSTGLARLPVRRSLARYIENVRDGEEADDNS